MFGRLVPLGHRFGAFVMVHEDIDAAVAAEADGVHLPSVGNVDAARSRLPEGLIGASAHSAAEAAAFLRAATERIGMKARRISATDWPSLVASALASTKDSGG